MTAYRKRPVVVDAVQWLAHGDDPDVRPLTPEDPCGNGPCEVDGLRPEVHGWISTLEAGHRVCPGDWLITGVKGERYPCKSDVFERTYEPAPEVTAPGAGTPAAVPEDAPKCRDVKRGHVDLQCMLPLGHDKPGDDQPGTWHEAMYTDRREVTYDGARHVIHLTEHVTWEPVDRVAEATRHLMAGRRA